MAHDVAHGHDSGNCEHCVILVQRSEDQETTLIFFTLAQVISSFTEGTLQTTNAVGPVYNSTVQHECTKSSGFGQKTLHCIFVPTNCSAIPCCPPFHADT